MGHEHDPTQREQLKSFDMMASVDLLRFDIVMYGGVLPETRQRVHDEEMSLMSEGVNRVMQRPDRLPRVNGKLSYFNEGEWQPYMGMLATGLEAARQDAQRDYRKSFLVEWAVRDYERGYQMERLQPGEKMTWVNPYPEEMERLYGAEFLRKECGLFPERKMGFIYVATGNEDGSVTLESQTVDNSDADAFDAVERAQGYDDEYDIDTLVRTYDGTMVKKYGGHFYAGRRGARREDNAWTQLLKHRDVIEYYMNELEVLAASDMPRQQLEQQTKQLTIGVWKIFRKRLDGQLMPPQEQAYQYGEAQNYSYNQATHTAHLAALVVTNYQEAYDLGEIKPGCGGGLAARGGIDEGNIDGRATFDGIFGAGKDGSKKSGETKYDFDKKMYCVVCQAPPQKQEGKKMCGPCGICKGCDTKIRTKSKGAYALAA